MSGVSNIEISVRGKWIEVPAWDVAGVKVVIRGRVVRVASVHDEMWLATEIGDPERFVAALKQRPSGPVADVFTFTQKPSNRLPQYKYPFVQDSVAVAEIPSFEEWWAKLPQETRKNVRRAEKRGVTVRLREFDEDLIREIADVNNDSPMRQGIPNVHYGKSLEAVRKDEQSFIDRSDFICAYDEGKVIGFLKLVHRGETASILNLAAKASHFDKRPSNTLIAKAVEMCAAKGVAYLTYGMYNYGHKHDSPLRTFKKRNGFEEVLVPRYYVPLTAVGSVYVKAGFHRGLIGVLPTRIINLGLSVRGKWYDLRYSSKPV